MQAFEAGDEVTIRAPRSQFFGRRAVVTGTHAKLVLLDFGDGTSGTWMVDELEPAVCVCIEDDGAME